MVIDLLELSRLDAGATELQPEEVDLVDLCDKVSQRYGYGELPIEVHRRASAKRWSTGSGSNGSSGTCSRTPRHTAAGRSASRSNPSAVKRSVLMAVEDQGPGVAASERTRIFERFARGSAARHRIGTGLGLALVAEHAAALGGEAWVEDRPGGGARFVVRLPTEGAVRTADAAGAGAVLPLPARRAGSATDDNEYADRRRHSRRRWSTPPRRAPPPRRHHEPPDTSEPTEHGDRDDDHHDDPACADETCRHLLHGHETAAGDCRRSFRFDPSRRA